MRRSALAALLLPGIVLLAGCGSRDTSQPVEPSFGFVAADCPEQSEQTELYNHILGGIKALFDTRQAQKAAVGHIDNIYREVCKDPADYDAALQHLNSFVQQVAGQPDDKLAQDAQDWDDLVNWAMALATVSDKIPAEAFGQEGGLGIIDLSSGLGSVVTRDRTAKVTIVKDDGAGPFIVAVTHKDGEVDVVSNHHDVGTDNALVELCVPDGYFDDWEWVKDRIVLQHGAMELLEPLGSDICGTTSTMMPASTSGTSWLGRVASWAGNAARTLFGPEPVRAMYFAGRGLGGLTGSFSPFVAVDPYEISAIDGPDPSEVAVGQTVEMTVTVSWPPEAPDATPNEPPMEWKSDGTGSVTFADNSCALGTDELVCRVSVTGATQGDAIITATYPGLQETTPIRVVPPPTLTVTVGVETPGLLKITDQFGRTCQADDKKVAPVTCEPWTYAEGAPILTAVVHQKIEGSWKIWMEAADGTLLQEVKPSDEEEPYVFPIDLDKYNKVTFTLLH